MLLVKVALNETGPFMPAEVVQGGRAGGSGAISLEGRSVMLTQTITTPRASDVQARSRMALSFLSPCFFLSSLVSLCLWSLRSAFRLAFCLVGLLG